MKWALAIGFVTSFGNAVFARMDGGDLHHVMGWVVATVFVLALFLEEVRGE